MYSHILLPTDGTPGTEWAAEHALSLAAAYDARLSVLYVVDESSLPVDAHAQSALQELQSLGRESVDAVVRQAHEREIPEVRPVVRQGTPHLSILDYARTEGCDLVVMGTHGRTGLSRYLLGSVTARVLRKARIPVLAVPM